VAVQRSPRPDAAEVELELAIPGVVSLYVFLQPAQIIGVDGEPEAIRAVPAISHRESAGQGTGEFLCRHGYERHCRFPLMFLWPVAPADRPAREKQRRFGGAAGVTV